MKLQLSMEFVLYVALVSASTASALSLFVYARGSLAGRTSSVYSEELAALINANMAYADGTFSAFVPADFCESVASGNQVRSSEGVFLLDGNITVAESACVVQGSLARLELSRLLNGTYLLRGA